MRRLLACLLLVLALPASALADVRAKASLREVSDPRAAGMDPSGVRRVDAILNAAIRKQVTPGAALAIGRYGKLVRLRGYGRTDYSDGAARVNEHTLYDLASLTKAVGTTSAVMLLVQQQRLDLDAPLGTYLLEWRGAFDRVHMTARHLLSHTSGLPPGGPLKGVGRDRSLIPAVMAAMPLTSPPGARYEYSDYGMILLGALVERIAGERLDAFLDRHLFQPAGLFETGFVPLDLDADDAISSFRLTSSRRSLIDRIAPTERTRSRGHIRGVVHDPLAYRLNGVAGNAGMFSSAHDLAQFAQLLLAGGVADTLRIFDTDVLRAFTTRKSPGSRFALGWEMAREGGPSGDLFPASAFGHTGFTGTSIWIDPEHDLYVVLLTNRVSPNASERRHAQLRRDLHDAIQKALLPG